MFVLAAINLRGVGESVKFNVVLTLIEMSALVIVIVIGFVVMARGDGDLSRITVFDSQSDRGLFLAVTVATTIAFFAMVGFEDSVNMVEETEEPERIFPKVMLTGLGIAVLFYVLVAISVVAVIPAGEIDKIASDEGQVLLNVVKIGAPDLPIDKVFPFLTVVAVANTALLNMLMASRLLYGMANQDVLPRVLGKVLPGRRTPYAGIAFSTALALGLTIVITYASDTSVIGALSGTTVAAAAGRLRGRQRGLPRAAPRPDSRPRLHAPRLDAVRRGRGRASSWSGRGPGPRRLDPVQDRGRPAGHRDRAVGAHLGHQPGRPREEDRLPRHRAPGGLSRACPRA